MIKKLIKEIESEFNELAIRYNEENNEKNQKLELKMSEAEKIIKKERFSIKQSLIYSKNNFNVDSFILLLSLALKS